MHCGAGGGKRRGVGGGGGGGKINVNVIVTLLSEVLAYLEPNHLFQFFNRKISISKLERFFCFVLLFFNLKVLVFYLLLHKTKHYRYSLVVPHGIFLIYPHKPILWVLIKSAS